MKARLVLSLFVLCSVMAALVALNVRQVGSSRLTANLSAQNLGPGPYCMDDTGQSPLNCTSNDTRISQIRPSLTSICFVAGDVATATFYADLVIGASTRWDLAMYIATDGNSALNGNSCYKDVLQPVADLDAAGNPTNPDGTGPFKNEDGDTCGDANQTVGAYYKLQQPLAIQCVDKDNDGVVDPISTCLSWGNEKGQFVCAGVISATMPGPGGPAKCNCEDTSPQILFYRGYDWGDLPDTYATISTTDGARHAVQDTNGDGAPDTITNNTVTPTAVIPAVWLGQRVDYSPNGETNGIPSTDALGDDITAPYDDEDGIMPFGEWWPAGTTATFTVTVNSSNGTCTGCKLGIWIDWNGDGDFSEANEAYTKAVSFGTQTVTLAIPSGVDFAKQFYARFRLYAGNYIGSIVPDGLVVNGEVEDYYFRTPTAVSLRSLQATRGNNAIILTWTTASETDNLGFNLYRATSPNGERVRINQQLITSQAYPGSPQGAEYEYIDVPGKMAKSYYYWLEDVDIHGVASLHGPVSDKLIK